MDVFQMSWASEASEKHLGGIQPHIAKTVWMYVKFETPEATEYEESTHDIYGYESFGEFISKTIVQKDL